MKIILEVENEQEEKELGFKKVVHKNVKELFCFGLWVEKKLFEKQFHYWTGSNPFLIGRCYYLLKQLERWEVKNDAKK